MKKLGIIFDSFVCLTKDEAEQSGYYYIPLIAEIDDKPYLDGVDVDRYALLEQMAKTENIKTSLPYMAEIEQVFTKASQENDEVIYFPISSKLSSTFSAAQTVASEFKNIHLIDTSFVGDQYLEVVEYVKKHFAKHQDIELLKQKIAEIEQKSVIFILPQDIKYLVKGGRVSSFKKFVLGALSKVKIYPFIRFDANGTSTGGMGRGPKGAIKQIIGKLEEFTGLKITDIVKSYKLFSINGIDKEFNDLAVEAFKQHGVEFNNIKFNSSVIAIHTGPQAHAYYIIPDLSNWEI
ncbi:DegV family protein [Mycoplasma simbae]|uniref:DegV family protein n=1 Tax=Mycoplasma simbae TaxID=36744 RepID=UPI000494F081|nr:DegV family protein [Mycoplasma simbae]